MTKLVSVVVPVYNMGDRIEKCIKSVLMQDYTNIEVILVDDGSKDNSLEQCNKLLQTDNRIKVIHTENCGSGPARNTGINHATGSYVYFPDADDYMEPNTISILVESMEKNDCDLVVFGFKRVDYNGKQIDVKQYTPRVVDAEALRLDYSDCMSTTSLWGIQGAPWNKFFSLNTIKDNHIEYPSLRRHQDEGFIGRYMCYAQKICFISEVLYTYYVNTLQLEWEKYPTNYIDAVRGLFQVRRETILSWNPNDVKTHTMVELSFITGVIKSMELVFSPKKKLNRAERKKELIEIINISQIDSMRIATIFNMPYQKKVMLLISKGSIDKLYFLLQIKVLIESKFHPAFSTIKRVTMNLKWRQF